MAEQLDAWTLVGSAAASGSASFPVSAGSDRYLLYFSSLRLNGVTVTGVQYGDQPMALLEEEIALTGQDTHVSVWGLTEAGIAAAVGDSFTRTYSASSVGSQFREHAASYENVGQTTPIADSFAAVGDSGAAPTASALTTDSDGHVVAVIGDNDGQISGDSDVSWANVTEDLETLASQSYQSMAEATASGSNITPTPTPSNFNGSVLIGISLAGLSGAALGPAALQDVDTVNAPTLGLNVAPGTLQDADTVNGPAVIQPISLAVPSFILSGTLARPFRLSGDLVT
jgi:hypothetical protein